MSTIKKLFLGYLFVGLAFMTMQGQNLYVSPDTSYVEGDVSEDFEVVAHSFIHNETGSNMELSWHRVTNNLDSNWSGSAVCDKNKCYASSADEPTSTFNIADGDSGLLDVHFYHANDSGSGWVKVIAYDVNDSANTNFTAVYFADVTDTSTTSVVKLANPDEKVSIYPNPVQNRLNVYNGAGIEVNKIEIFNLLGEKVRSYTIESNKMRYSFHIAHLPRGMYFIQGSNKASVVFTKSISKVE